MSDNDSNFLSVYRYCPKCGQPMQPVSQGGSLMPTCTSQKCKYIFWQNAKPCVVAVIQNEHGQVLMTERGIEPDKGKLDLQIFLSERVGNDSGIRLYGKNY